MLLATAGVFALYLLLYTDVAVLRRLPPVYLGLEWKPESAPDVTIKTVVPGLPAENPATTVNNRILSGNGYRPLVLAFGIAHGNAEDMVSLRVQQPTVTDQFRVPVSHISHDLKGKLTVPR